MIRVLHIISDTNIGGAGKSLLNYFQYYDRAAFHMEAVVPRRSALTPLIRQTGVPCHEVNCMADRSLDPAAILPLRRIIRATKPDIVHTHGSLSGRIASRLALTHVLYTRHCAFPPHGILNTPPGRFLNGTLDRLLADRVISIGSSTRDSLELCGIPGKRIRVLYNGVAPLTIPNQEQRRRAREHLGLRDESFSLGIIARVEPYKGHDTVFEAVKLLLARGLPVQLVVAGDGSCLEDLKKKALSFPPDTICFLGFVADVEPVLWGLDLQINASYESETSSLSLLEGMSIGLPAAASDIGGNPHLIRHGENGLIFPARNSTALADAVVSLAENPDMYARMSNQAIRIFRENFTGEIFARNMESIYRELVPC